VWVEEDEEAWVRDVFSEQKDAVFINGEITIVAVSNSSWVAPSHGHVLPKRSNRWWSRKTHVKGGVNHPRLLQCCLNRSRKKLCVTPFRFSFNFTNMDLGFTTLFCNISSFCRFRFDLQQYPYYLRSEKEGVFIQVRQNNSQNSLGARKVFSWRASRTTCPFTQKEKCKISSNKWNVNKSSSKKHT